jgi:hypothetical protein
MARKKSHKDKPTPREVTSEELRRLEEELHHAAQELGSPKATVRWFLEFAETDLKGLSPTGRALQSYKLLAAAGASKEGWPTQKSVTPMDLKMLLSIQREMNQALTVLFSDTAYWSLPGSKAVELTRTSDKGAKETTFEIATRTFSTRAFALHGFFYALFKGGKFLRACARCTKPFVATKRQEYCSSNCSQITRNEKKKRLWEERKRKLQ